MFFERMPDRFNQDPALRADFLPPRASRLVIPDGAPELAVHAPAAQAAATLAVVATDKNGQSVRHPRVSVLVLVRRLAAKALTAAGTGDAHPITGIE